MSRRRGSSNMVLSFWDRLISALMHAAVVSPHGMLVGLIVLFVSQSRSQFIFSQTKQALGYQVITHGIMFVAMIVLPLLGVEIPDVEIATMEDIEQIATVWVVVGLYGLLQWGYGFFGAWKSFKGEDFRYILIGDYLENL